MVLVDMSERESEDWEKKGRRVTIDLDEVIVRSDGSKATMRCFFTILLNPLLDLLMVSNALALNRIVVELIGPYVFWKNTLVINLSAVLPS